MYKLFLTVRYLRKRRIVFFAIAAVTLCTAMVLVVMSVMGGWLDQIKLHARGLLGDIIVDNRSYQGFPLYQEFIAEIKQWPEVVEATPVIHSYSLLRFPNTGQTATIQVVGIRLDEVYRVNAFKSGLFYEKYFPGTTALAEQQRPVLGVDRNAAPTPTTSGEYVFTPLLPEPFRSALERKRDELRRSTGRELDDAAESVNAPLADLMRSARLPVIPGEWSLDRESVDGGFVGDPRPGVILGRDIVARRHADGRYERLYPKGQLAVLTLIPTTDTGNVEQPIKQPCYYVDDSRTGIYDIDSRSAYVDFDRLQKLLKMHETERADGTGTIRGRCSQIQIKTRDGLSVADLDALARRMTSTYHGLIDKHDLDATEISLVTRTEAMTWQRSQAHIIGPVEKERGLVTILFGIISLVAVALVLCILYMIVLQKTRDIGIVKAIGATSFGVATVWVMYGLAVGVVGAALGAVLGSLFVWNINEVQDALISLNPGWRVWDLQVYSFDRIPSTVDPVDATVIVAIAIAASTVGSLAAAWRAGAMQPVEAIRYE